jgi:hypothetical protein
LLELHFCQFAVNLHFIAKATASSIFPVSTKINGSEPHNSKIEGLRYLPANSQIFLQALSHQVIFTHFILKSAIIFSDLLAEICKF